MEIESSTFVKKNHNSIHSCFFISSLIFSFIIWYHLRIYPILDTLSFVSTFKENTFFDDAFSTSVYLMDGVTSFGLDLPFAKNVLTFRATNKIKSGICSRL